MQNRVYHLGRLVAGTTLLLAATALSSMAQDNAAMCLGGFGQAPQLQAMVDAGNLPPVADRLPVEPLVVQPAEGIGSYGGRFVDSWGGGNVADFRQFAYDPLVRWSVDGSTVEPNIAKSWDISEDATSYTFHLREGMKWSDGQPFTADDIVFWWEHVENNPKVMTGGPRGEMLNNGGKPTVTKVDDYTVTFTYEQPNGLFLQNMAGPYGQRVVMFPKHYMEQVARSRRAQPRLCRALSACLLGWPTATYRHRPRPGVQSATGDRRRGSVGARCVGADPDHQHDARTAGRTGPYLSVCQP